MIVDETEGYYDEEDEPVDLFKDEQMPVFTLGKLPTEQP